MLNLQNILNAEGQEFLDNLLNKEVVVNEKLNAATLSFQKKITSEMDMNRNLTFYKGSGTNKKEITVADRVMTNFYSTGMTYLNNMSKIIIDKIPGNWTFVCKYFPNHQPSFINYSVLPKNNLVLSCIMTSGGTRIEDVEDLRPWAEMFDISYQEPVFRGYLSEYQKTQLNDYLKNGSSKESFSRFIITLLNPNLKHSLYQNDGFDKPIDGFIFKFISDDGITKPISAKLIDPYMTSLIVKNKSNKGYKDNTDVLLSDFVIFMTSQDMDSIILNGKSEDDRYLELFYRLFNRYIKYKKDQLEDFDVDTNDVVKESIDVEFDVDLDKISNETTKKILKENPEYKPIFKTLLGSFKSKKPEDYKSLVMSPGVVRLFNGVVDAVNQKIKKDNKENNYSFSSYLDVVHKNHEDDDIEEPKVPEVINTNSEIEIKNPEHQILSFADFQKKEKSKEDNERKEELKSIEDMIKDLKRDVESMKGDVKDVKDGEEKVEKEVKEDEKKEKEEKEKIEKEKDEKTDDKKEEKEEKKIPEKEDHPEPTEKDEKDEDKDNGENDDEKVNEPDNDDNDTDEEPDNDEGDDKEEKKDTKKNPNPLAEL